MQENPPKVLFFDSDCIVVGEGTCMSSNLRLSESMAEDGKVGGIGLDMR